MPKEQQKRGRRGDKKRQRADEDEISEVKRQKHEDQGGGYEEHQEDQSTQVFQNEDYIPLESSRGGTGEFYGLLDEEEQAYFKSADQILESNQFTTADERLLFLESVWNEARGKELKLASSQSSSRLMEKLIQLSTTSQLKSLFEKFDGHFLSLVQHRFASHCCEALLLRSAPVVTEELVAYPSPTAPEESGVKPMEKLFLQVLAELNEYMGYLMTDKFASHAVRVLLVVLSGHSLEEASGKSLLRGRNKERIGTDYTEIKENKDTTTRSVPSSFSRALEETVGKMIGQLDANHLRSFATQPLGNPVLQLLLEIEFERVGKEVAKDEQSLFRKLLPEIPLVEGSMSARFVRGLLYDPIGSHLLETIITCSPGKTFKSIYIGELRDNLKSIVRNDNASYVLSKALERLSAEDLQFVLKQIDPEIPFLLEDSRTSVLRTLIERYHVRKLNDEEIGNIFREHFDRSNSFSLEKIFGLVLENQQNALLSERSQEHDQNTNYSHISLLLQKMLEHPGSLREIVNEAIKAASPTALVAAVHDKSATYLVQSALLCQNQPQNFRRILLQKFSGKASELALGHVSSYVFDAFWKATTDLRFLRERIAQELARDQAALRESRSGRIVWRTWMMDLFTNKRKSWIDRSKEFDALSIENGAHATASKDENKKTDLDKARERFASHRANEGRRAPKTPQKRGAEHSQVVIGESSSPRSTDEEDHSMDKVMTSTNSGGITGIEALS
ncbi:Nucleolar protein 9 [Thelotrema lepadinum]|nr:Nucleolar protein 9 [Thelotrema lepadinum]